MKKRLFAAALCGMLACASTQAQPALSHESNGLLEGDFTRHGIDFFDAGQGGEDLLWEYPIEFIDNHETEINVGVDFLGVYRMTDDTHAEFYLEKADSTTGTTTWQQFQCREESPLSKTDYVSPLLRIKYPFEYGDSIARPFHGEGVYCGDHHFIKRGATTVIADATGSLVVDEGDTLRNVLRVYTLKSYSICMDMNPAALDTAKLRQVIEETYEWYVRGNRYPVLQTKTSTSYDNMQVLGTKCTAYCCLPSDLLSLNDSVNREVQRKDSIAEAQREAANRDIIHYEASVSGGVITLDYDLDAPAHIVTLVADAFGMTYRRAEWTQQDGSGYTRRIDCNGLRRGTYILYINVNGRIYSEKVSL